MAKRKEITKRRTQVKDIPKSEKELTSEEQKQVKGGIGSAALIISSFAKPPGQ